MELVKLKQSTQELYNDIDSCITDLINARLPKDEEAEKKALFRMEGLMVATLQQLACILEWLPNSCVSGRIIPDNEAIFIPTVWTEEGMKKSPSRYSWAKIDDDGHLESGVTYYDADGHEITQEEYEALLGQTPD